jgi:beta-lactamase class A
MAVVAISLPAPYEASDGRIEGRAPAATTDVGVFVSGDGHYRLVTMHHLEHGGKFAIPATGLPAGDRSLKIIAYASGKALGSKVVRPVSGLPRLAFRTRAAKVTEARVQRRLKGIDGPGVRAVWMRGLASGDAASYNAGARFTAASTLKLGILMASLAHNRQNPVGGPVWSSYKRMVLDSDNVAANSVEVQMGGSTSGGSSMVNGLCRQLGCRDTDMYGGYTPNSSRPIPVLARMVTSPAAPRAAATVPPVRTERSPSIGAYGKHTTAHDLGVLASTLVEAGGGRGKARRAGISRHEARVAIYLLIHARYRGLVRPNVHNVVGHKSGWLGGVEHDAALVFTPQGTVVTVIMSQGGGVGLSGSGRYAGRVLKLALARLR